MQVPKLVRVDSCEYVLWSRLRSCCLVGHACLIGYVRPCGSTDLNLGLTRLYGLTGCSGPTDLLLGPIDLYGPTGYNGSTDLNLEPTCLYGPIGPSRSTDLHLGPTCLYGPTGCSGSMDLNLGLRTYIAQRDAMGQRTWIWGLTDYPSYILVLRSYTGNTFRSTYHFGSIFLNFEWMSLRILLLYFAGWSGSMLFITANEVALKLRLLGYSMASSW